VVDVPLRDRRRVGVTLGGHGHVALAEQVQHGAGRAVGPVRWVVRIDAVEAVVGVEVRDLDAPAQADAVQQGVRRSHEAPERLEGPRLRQHEQGGLRTGLRALVEGEGRVEEGAEHSGVVPWDREVPGAGAGACGERAQIMADHGAFDPAAHGLDVTVHLAVQTTSRHA
jgi:hypothetical protein